MIILHGHDGNYIASAQIFRISCGGDMDAVTGQPALAAPIADAIKAVLA